MKRYLRTIVKLFLLWELFLFFVLVLLKVSLFYILIALLGNSIFCMILWLLNIKMRRWLNPNTYPDNDWYRENLERNFDCLILGDKNIFAIEDSKEEKSFDLSLNGQTLKWDFMILKQYFSILKPHGKVFFVIVPTHIWKGWNDVEDIRPYYMCMRPYVFTQNRIKQIFIKTARRLPIVMFRISDLIKKRKKICKLKEDKDKTIELMKEIVGFCKDRQIDPIVRFSKQISFSDSDITLFKNIGITIEID